MPSHLSPSDPPVSSTDRMIGVQLVRRHVVGRIPRPVEPRPSSAPGLSVAAVAATGTTALVLSVTAARCTVSALREWGRTGSAGMQDPDLHGLGALVAGTGAVVTGVVAVAFAVAAWLQTRPSTREGAVRTAALLHLVIALLLLPGSWSAGPAGAGPAVVAGVLLGVDMVIVGAAAVDRRCRAWCRPPGLLEPR